MAAGVMPSSAWEGEGETVAEAMKKVARKVKQNMPRPVAKERMEADGRSEKTLGEGAERLNFNLGAGRLCSLLLVVDLPLLGLPI